MDPGQYSWTEGPRLLDFCPGLVFICGLARMGLKKSSSGTEFLRLEENAVDLQEWV